jgi:hypothetical protein
MLAYTVHDLVLPLVLGIFSLLWMLSLWHICGRRWFPPKWSLFIGLLGTIGGLAIAIIAGILTYRRTH